MAKEQKKIQHHQTNYLPLFFFIVLSVGTAGKSQNQIIAA